jgi:hypothetical protein
MKFPENKLISDFKLFQGKDKDRVEFVKFWEFDYVEQKIVSAIWKHDLKVEGRNAEFRFNGDYKDNSVSFDAIFGYQKVKSFLKLKNMYKPAGDFDLTMSGGFNKHNFKFLSKHAIEGKKSKFDNKLTVSTGTVFELHGIFGHRFTYQEADIKFDGSLIPFENKEPYK